MTGINRRGFFAVGGGAIALLAAAACSVDSGSPSSGGKGRIGISMPTKSSERWVADGSNIVNQFQALGYTTDLQYAEDVIETQVSQLENMLTQGATALVIAAIDNKSLTGVLAQAKRNKVAVIAYDRLIRDTADVDYYATFDNFEVGVLQAAYLVEHLGVAVGPGPFNIELFAGSPDDNNTYFFFNGAMSVLQPHIDTGKLVVRSGQTRIDQVTTLRWDGATAQSRMENLLSAHYAAATVDAVLSPYDGVSIGILSALKAVGYGGARKMPIVTGQDAEKASVKSIIAGEQTQTVFKDTRKLAERAVQMTNAILTGGTPETNDTTSYENGRKKVPSYLLRPVSVDKTNYRAALIDTGYYTDKDLQ
ncbi:multiple monosaccharide ABC transporter substrate-binding protein [Nocardia goodfellowii]|uniref:Multiple sugar transport system substrate-binding protein n=1 Tax=Nocardia goodfellowii TaxID=882446 RepID=A0ABS4QNI9_9NOCA|nr:multiple monosaccharide ABC transporter substrate-binding protein [Nocardia goodfellowii]MBP2193279.1 putative multiple sugar transport system substrate-binding protein [Nocardia goodfellowii]